MNCQTCHYCLSAKFVTYVPNGSVGHVKPSTVDGYACHFWPPTPFKAGDQPSWPQVQLTDWCGQWSADGEMKFGITPAAQINVPVPSVSVAAAEPVVIPAPTVNVTAPQGPPGPPPNGYVATSKTLIEVAIGTVRFTIQPGLSFVPYMAVRAYSLSDDTNFMTGQIVSYNGASMVVNMTAIGGQGSFSDWVIIPSA